MEETSLPVPHLEKGWLSSMRKRLNDLGGCVMIKDQWAPQIQRERDRSIMQRFCKLTKSKCVGATVGRLRIANELHIWLQVITVADLANVGGTCIPYGRLDGSWRNCSTLNWPDQPHPSEKMFGVFRGFLRKTFCTKPQRQPLHNKHAPG